MPTGRRRFRASALALLVAGCVWVIWRSVSFAEYSSGEFGVATTRVANARAWYPTTSASVVGKLRSALTLDADARDAAPAATAGPFPVLIYFGGWPGTHVDNRGLIRALVGQGFVVVTMDPPGGSNVAPAGAGSLEGARGRSPMEGGWAEERPMDFSSEAAYQDTLQRADARVRQLARQAVAWLDALEALSRFDPSGRFTGRLDLSRVGILGYSFGGAVAAQAAWMDPRFRAVMNLDGWSFGEAAEQGIRQPYLFISDDTPIPTAADLSSPDPVRRYTSRLTRKDYERLLHNLALHGGVYLQVAGTRHESFVDPGRRARIRALLGLGEGLEGASAGRVQLILKSYATAFFRNHLQGQPSALLSGPSPRFPEVRWQPLS